MHRRLLCPFTPPPPPPRCPLLNAAPCPLRFPRIRRRCREHSPSVLTPPRTLFRGRPPWTNQFAAAANIVQPLEVLGLDRSSSTNATSGMYAGSGGNSFSSSSVLQPAVTCPFRRTSIGGFPGAGTDIYHGRCSGENPLRPPEIFQRPPAGPCPLARMTEERCPMSGASGFASFASSSESTDDFRRPLCGQIAYAPPPSCFSDDSAPPGINMRLARKCSPPPRPCPVLTSSCASQTGGGFKCPPPERCRSETSRSLSCPPRSRRKTSRPCAIPPFNQLCSAATARVRSCLLSMPPTCPGTSAVGSNRISSRPRSLCSRIRRSLSWTAFCKDQAGSYCSTDGPTALGKKLLIAAEEGKTDRVRKLLELGADANFTYGSEWTPLHKAARKGHAQVVSLLLQNGACANARTSYGLTALHIAASNDYSGLCVSYLINAGADMSVKNRSGRTALHYAAESGNGYAVRSLVAAGACKYIKNNIGETPFDVAKTHCVRRLLLY